ncbi:hypothetical protein [Mycoplasma todarodis]|uniref:hypothetical protein n=1 Tax=Mycoplasma todarodis TaxID=1937191 RepID=UPI003B388C4D
MSHSAVIILANQYSETLSNCDETIVMIDKLEANMKIGATLTKQIGEMRDSLINFQKELMTGKRTIDIDRLRDLDVEISSKMKRIVGMRGNLDFFTNLEETTTHANEKINEVIVEHGYLARVAIESLKENGETINPEAILKEIDKVATKEQNQTRVKEFMGVVMNMLKELKFNKTIQQNLYMKATHIKNAQEFGDFIAFVESKAQARKNIERILKDEIVPAAKLVELKRETQKFYINDQNEIYAKVKFMDQQAGELEMTIDELGKVKYQMGNYKGHLCHTKAKKIWKEVLKERKILSEKITRDYSGQERLEERTMSSKSNLERGK